MKIALIIIGIVVAVLIVVFVAVVAAAGAKFEPYAEAVLVSCRDGNVDDVYRKASDPFRRDVSLEKFREYVESRRVALGAFRKIVKKTGGGISTSTGSGTIGTVSLRLAYEKAEADGEFKFLKEGDDWRLLSMQVAFDEALLPKADPARLEPLTRELLALYDAAQFTALYQRFSQPLKDAWKADAYEPQMRDLFAKAGKTTSATLRETKAEDGGKTRLLFDLQFENGPGDGAFAWVWDGTRWQIVGWNLHLAGAK